MEEKVRDAKRKSWNKEEEAIGHNIHTGKSFAEVKMRFHRIESHGRRKKFLYRICALGLSHSCVIPRE